MGQTFQTQVTIETHPIRPIQVVYNIDHDNLLKDYQNILIIVLYYYNFSGAPPKYLFWQGADNQACWEGW